MNEKTDAKTFRESYADGEYNYIMEVESTSFGLYIDETVTVPWSWILRALADQNEILETK